MGIFGNKLLLRLIATPTSSGKLEYNAEKVDHKMTHILPFSCISLIGSQLTVLTSHHSRSLSMRLLEFAETPTIQYETTTLVAGFQLEIYKGRGQTLYNQFSPQYTRNPFYLDNDLLETEIEQTLLNHVITVYENAGSSDKLNLRIYLLMTVAFFQESIIPFMKRVNTWNINIWDINTWDIENRIKLARAVIDFCSMVYERWDNPPKSIAPGTPYLFRE
jgi:hypothetical protein